MSVISSVKNLYEFSKNVEDKNFKDFTKNLLCFCEEQKKKENINDIEVFDDLIKKQFNINEDKKYKDILAKLILNLKENGFIYYKNFYNDFKLNFKTQNNEEEENNSLSDSIVSELTANARFSKLLEAQKAVENMEKNAKDDKNNENTEENLEQDFNLNQNENKDLNSVTPSQMIDFIKDEKTLMFPFTKESTLENKSFMKAFYKDLNAKSNQELEFLLAKIRAKNEALRMELKELKQNKSDKEEQIIKELEINSNLSNIKEQKEEQNKTMSIDEMNAKINESRENLKQSKENYNKNKWFLYKKMQENDTQENEKDIQENKENNEKEKNSKTYKR